MELAASSTPVKTERTLSTDGVVLDVNGVDNQNSLSVVFSSLNHLTPPAPPAAVLPCGSDCGSCGLFEDIPDHMVVCDGCDRGFHLECAQKSQPLCVDFDVDVDADGWMCGECASNAVPCSRWPLGFKVKVPAKQNGTIAPSHTNSLPIINGETEGGDEPDSRKHPPGDNSFGGDRFGVPVTFLNLLHGENGFNFREASHVVTPFFNSFTEDKLHHTEEVSSITGEVKLQSEVLRSGSQTGIRMQPQSPEEMHLEALREYVREKNGTLDAAWSVIFKQPRNIDKPHAIFCSPDGKTFRSMAEVACYLGLMPNRGRKRSDDHTLPETESHLLRRRKSARHAAAGSVAEIEEPLLVNLAKQESSSSRTAGSSDKFGNHVNVIESLLEEIREGKTKKLDDRLPVQLEDFFLLSCGKIDMRPAYHNANQIWPVGYKSCWHDKITGSFFVCEISDGGDCGPKFIVRRCSCSAFPVPSCSTIICRPTMGNSGIKNEEKTEDHDEDLSVLRLLAEPSPPREHDILSCLSSSFIERQDLRASKDVRLQASASRRPSRHLSPYNMGLRDEIGNFLVEESSTSSAWRGVSEKFNEICHAMYKQNGRVRFFCEHAEGADAAHESWEDQFSFLAKFHGSLNCFKIPIIIQDDKEMQSYSENLMKWLSQDRFGLDMEFVQELVELLPGATACSRYVICKERSSPTSSVMAGNGKLHFKTKDVGPPKFEGTFKCPESKKKPRKQMDDDPVIHSRSFPPGKHISSRLPPQCVGNVLQAHEFLWRFNEVLELQEPLSFKKLEEELIHPRFVGSDFLENVGGGYKESQGRAMPSESDLSSSLNSGPVVSAEGPYAFIPTEPGAMREAVEARMGPFSYDRSMGCALTKVHKSLLTVLISELQLRVVAVLDPNADGESKPKRGRKKDVDSWISGKRAKFNLLPLNELTWPEMSRRYILAFLSMCCGLMDTNTRESARIFRCLQGDGGFLCGSKIGVVGKEEDAKLLAGAMNRIFRFSDRDDDILYMEDMGDGTSCCKTIMTSDYHVPDWVKVLEPVRKLATNVGARIRNRVNDALKLGPPEWAKSILEHSISKGVYKGNASGPTKKCVLQVIERVNAEIPLYKPDQKRRKKLALISEIIMRKCRIVLRYAAAASAKDDSGRKLINGTDDDDDGIRESLAMVSRPLDFRIIDMRLANGAYGGSHEAFLEDVRELCNKWRIAHSDKPNLVALTDELSTTFESLYEKEVVTLFGRLVECSKSENLSVETKKEIEELLASIREIPKAPWEDGVCKVCGIDKDDYSCLLCDGCDAEYHTYCLNPPLARIPGGKWYCPSCVLGKQQGCDAPEGAQRIFQRLEKYNGEFTHSFLDSLAHLAAGLDERNYWELSTEERAFLLKFLCDEVLNSSLVRQHLEQSLESSSELHQKVRSLCAELKNLQCKGEQSAAKDAKVDRSSLEAIGEVPTEEEYDSAQKTTDASVRELPLRTDQLNCPRLLPDEIEKHEDGDNLTMLSSGECGGFSPSLDLRSAVVDEDVLPIDANKPPPDNLELGSVGNEILLLQNTIASMERQLARLSVRREFLGSDSIGRLYWASLQSGRHCIVVDGSMDFLQRKRMAEHSSLENHHSILGHSACFTDELPTIDSSSASCPFICNLDGANPSCSAWVSYQSESEIKELVNALKHNDPNGRKLIDSILNWQKPRFMGSQQTEICLGRLGEPQMACTKSEDSGMSVPSTIAATFLHTRYGPLLKLETTEQLKSRKSTRAINERKMFRCACLEPVWLSRRHCLHCHKTFFTVMEFEGHTDCNRNVVSSVAVDSKKCTYVLEQKREPSRSAPGERREVDFLVASKSKCSGLGTGAIGSQNDALGCPFNFEYICSKFLIESSNKQLVKEIGLIGSNGIPSFVRSASPYLNDPTLHLVPPEGSSMQSEATGAWDANRGDVNLVEPSGKNSLINNAASLMEGSCPVVPKLSSRPVIGKDSHILRQLKINLLDMDAALPEEGMRPSRTRSDRRQAWCAFVKSAETIYEMVQATIVFEDMIKSEYLKRMWYYWSSVSSAMKISTMSQLALRIYSLDAAIEYEKSMVCSSRTEKAKHGGKPLKKKVEAEA